MNPQEQNKEKAPFVSQPANPSGVQKNNLPKDPLTTNIQVGAKDKDAERAKPTDKDASDCSTTKGSCGTK